MKPIRKGAIIFYFLLLLSSCAGNYNNQKQIIRKVKIETVREPDSLQVKHYPGIINEVSQVNLAFRVAGPIQKIMVKRGDYVRAGQIIAQIDQRDYEVQLEAARAQYDQVKAEADRVIELYDRESVAGNDYDKAVSGLKMVSAQLKNAEDQLNDTRLVAPVSGYIQEVNFVENELIDAGMPVASVIDVGHYQVELEIPVSVYVNRDDIVSFTGVQPEVSDESFPMKILSYSRKAGNNQLYKVQLRLDPSIQPKLAPGMDVEVNITLKSNEGSLACVPLNALFYEGGKIYVWVFQPDSTVEKREVSTGKLTGDGRILISCGLQADEQIVVAGVNLLNENERVEPLEPVSETNIGGLL